VLTPLIKREIIYRLLMGAQGNRLCQIAVLGGYTHHIARAVDYLRKDFNQPLRIESIAQELGMSVSGFHHHFKSVTAMSPLQFQKQLRLQEARRLMLGHNLDATSAAYRVGYDDASHFWLRKSGLFNAILTRPDGYNSIDRPSPPNWINPKPEIVSPSFISFLRMSKDSYKKMDEGFHLESDHERV
jgi:AraC-like DNA-binding protein